MQSDRQICDKYLRQYAEPEVKLLKRVLSTDASKIQNIDQVIVIPAYDETPDFVDRLIASKNKNNLLVVLVINQPLNQTQEYRENINNGLLFRYLVDIGQLCWQAENLCLLKINSISFLCVDRYSKTREINPKHGVGLARKIGADLALALIHSRRVTSNWIYATDADARLPLNYFNPTSAHTSSDVPCAKIFNFEHVSAHCEKVHKATQAYESAIKYYQQALQWSGSPYAFSTLGSTLAIDANAYTKVRGFPKKSAGEDFYLLNKLAKIGKILYEPKICIQLESRISHRVPFGTGPSVSNILSLNENGQTYCYYSVEIFIELKALLNDLTCLYLGMASLKRFSKYIQYALVELNIEKFLQHAHTQAKSNQQFNKQFHYWFDAFLTLKFVHILQREFFPPQPLHLVLAKAQKVFK